jgi:hypothetical protein
LEFATEEGCHFSIGKLIDDLEPEECH